MVAGFVGSTATRRTPRSEHGEPAAVASATVSHWAAVGAPLCRKVHVAPPSVDLYKPHAAAPGIRETAPPVTDDTPSTPRVVAAYTTFAAPGVTAMLPMDRPAKTDAPSGPVHVLPPSVDLYKPTPAAES